MSDNDFSKNERVLSRELDERRQKPTISFDEMLDELGLSLDDLER